MSFVGVVIINWNNSKDTIRCVNSLSHIKSCKLKILVIDNGSEKDDSKSLQKLNQIELITNDINVGYAKAVNQGIMHFQRYCPNINYLLLLNNDAYCKDDFLKVLIAELDMNPKLASISPNIYSTDVRPKLLDSGGVLDEQIGLISNNFLQFRHELCSSRPYLVDWVSGCANLLRFDAVKNVGYFTEVFEMYAEDVEFSIRLRRKGYELMYDSDSVIFHELSKSSGGSFSYLKRFFIARNTVLISKKYFGATFLLLTIYNLIMQCGNYPLPQRPYAFWTTVKGIFSGLVKSLE